MNREDFTDDIYENYEPKPYKDDIAKKIMAVLTGDWRKEEEDSDEL